MRRLSLLLLVVALCVPALADAGSKPRKRSVAGTVAAVSGSSVTVKSGDAALTCALPDSVQSPEVGSRVRISCRTTDGGKLVVVALEKLGTKPEAPKPPEVVDPTPPVQTEPNGTKRDARGSVTTFGDGVVTVTRPDGSSLSCAVTPEQLASLRSTFTLGSRMLLICRVDGSRLLFASAERSDEPAPTPPPKPEPPKTEPPKTEPPKPQPPATRDARGIVTTLSSDAVTVRPDAGGDSLRCRITPAADSSAAAAKLSLGAHVAIVCRRDGDGYVLSGASPVT